MTACAASTDGRRAADEHPVAFDLHRGWRLNPAATLRPEPFGAGVPVSQRERYAAALAAWAAP